MAGGVTVPVGPAHAGAIATAMRARTSSNGGVIAGANAPIRGAENVASTYLATLTDVGRKFILLATAGAPSCLPGSSDLGAGDAAGAVAAIVNASNAGFPTSVLGIATTGGIAEMTLNEMALSGNLAQMGSPSYTPVANIADASSGLRTLLGINPPCVVALPPGIAGPLTGSEIGVRVDGTYIPRDGAHLNGWDYVDPALTSIEVYGPACETLLLGPPHTVSILLRCPVP